MDDAQREAMLLAVQTRRTFAGYSTQMTSSSRTSTLSTGLLPARITPQSSSNNVISNTNTTNNATLQLYPTLPPSRLPPVHYAPNGHFHSPALSYDTFLMYDTHPSRQRLLLTQLARLDMRLQSDRQNRDETPLKWKRPKDMKTIDLHVDVKVPYKRSSTRDKLNAFIKAPSKKKTNQSFLFHLIRLAIRDRDQWQACQLMQQIRPASMKKKRMAEANRIMLMAMMHQMDNAVILMLEHGFPSNVNHPIFRKRVGATSNALLGNIKSVGALSGSTNVLSGSTNLLSGGKKLPTISMFPSYFIVAVGLGNENMIKSMIKHGANVNQTWCGLSPLHLACQLNGTGHTLIVKLLLENGADPTLPVPLEQYSMLRRLKFGRFFGELLKPKKNANNNANANSLTVSNQYRVSEDYFQGKNIYPIELAAACRNLDAVTLLLQQMQMASVSMVQKCLFSLLVQQDLDVSIKLLKAGANVQFCTAGGLSALHLAARVGAVDLMTVLLHYGADVNAVDVFQSTPLHEAAKFCQRESMRYLIRRGADSARVNEQGDTPFQLALRSGISSEELFSFFDQVVHSASSNQEETVKSLLARVNTVRWDAEKAASGSNLAESGGTVRQVKSSKRLFTIERFPGLKKETASLSTAPVSTMSPAVSAVSTPHALLSSASSSALDSPSRFRTRLRTVSASTGKDTVTARPLSMTARSLASHSDDEVHQIHLRGESTTPLAINTTPSQISGTPNSSQPEKSPSLTARFSLFGQSNNNHSSGPLALKRTATAPAQVKSSSSGSGWSFRFGRKKSNAHEG